MGFEHFSFFRKNDKGLLTCSSTYFEFKEVNKAVISLNNQLNIFLAYKNNGKYYKWT